MNFVEVLAPLLAPASLSLSRVALCVRKVASVMKALCSMATNVCHQQAVDAITEDAISKVVNSSGMVKNVEASAAVMEILG